MHLEECRKTKELAVPRTEVVRNFKCFRVSLGIMYPWIQSTFRSEKDLLIFEIKFFANSGPALNWNYAFRRWFASKKPLFSKTWLFQKSSAHAIQNVEKFTPQNNRHIFFVFITNPPKCLRQHGGVKYFEPAIWALWILTKKRQFLSQTWVNMTEVFNFKKVLISLVRSISHDAVFEHVI